MLHDVIAYIIKHDAVFAQAISVSGVIIAQIVTVYKILNDRKDRKNAEKEKDAKDKIVDTSIRYGVDKNSVNQAILDAVNVAIIIADHNCIITEWNEGACAMFGWRESEAVGRPVSLIIPHSLVRAHEDGLARFLRTGESNMIGKTIEIEAINRRNELIDVSISVSIGEFTDGHKFFCGIICPLAIVGRKEVHSITSIDTVYIGKENKNEDQHARWQIEAPRMEDAD